MPFTHLDILPPERDGDRVVLAATMRDEAAVRPDERFWFAVPERYADAITPSADPFLRALLFALLRRKQPVRVHGRASPLLLRNFEELQLAWHCWYPQQYTPIEIIADEEAAEPDLADPNQAISAFSGGVDSFYTLRAHVEGLVNRRRRNLRAAAMLNGLDWPRQPASVFRPAFERNRTALAELGVDLIPVDVNVREIDMQRNDAYVAVVMGAMSLFAPRFGAGLLPAGWSYNEFTVPFTSSPVTDHMMSGDGFFTVLDGSEWLRPEKIDAIADWPIARRLLRVCYKGEAPFENCGTCEKCVRTILAFRAGGHGLPEAFVTDVTDATIRAVRLGSDRAVTRFNDLRNLAIANGFGGEPWVATLWRSIRAQRWRNRFKKLRDWLRSHRARWGLYHGRMARRPARDRASVQRR